MPTDNRYPLEGLSDADLKRLYEFVSDLCETTSQLFDLQESMKPAVVMARNLEYVVMQRLYVGAGMCSKEEAENDAPPNLSRIVEAFEKGLDLMDEMEDVFSDSINEAVMEGKLFRKFPVRTDVGDFKEILESFIESDYAEDVFEWLNERMAEQHLYPPSQLSTMLDEIRDTIIDSCDEVGICDLCIFASDEVGRALRLAGEKLDAEMSTCDRLILDLYQNWMLSVNTFYYAGWSYTGVENDVFWLVSTNAFDHSGYGDYYDNDETFRNYGFPMFLAIMSECAKRINANAR